METVEEGGSNLLLNRLETDIHLEAVMVLVFAKLDYRELELRGEDVGGRAMCPYLH